MVICLRINPIVVCAVFYLRLILEECPMIFNGAKNLASLAKTKELTSGNTGDNITLPVANGNVKSVELEAVGPTRKQKLNKTISNFSDYD